jgi:Na+-translocating ferredoxin:NAD+ oxidoreductase RnfC subunit
MGEIIDYKPEMVLLYWPLQNEALDILDCNKFVTIYDQNKAQILSQRHKYESNLDINKTMEYCRQLYVERDNKAETQLRCETYLNMQNEDPNNDNIHMISDGIDSIVKTNSKVLSSDEYISMARLTNPQQRELLSEAIH